jgi:phosphotransacetylase
MDEKLSARIKTIERQVVSFERAMDDAQTTIKVAQESAKSYQTRIYELESLKLVQEQIIKDTLEQTKNLHDEMLVLNGKLDELKGFVSELF